MALISDAELLAIQDLAESGMISTVAVYKQTIVTTDDGQKTTYPSMPSFSVAGWLFNQTGTGGTISVLDGGGGIAQQIRLIVPVGTNIISGDKIVVSGETYFCQYTTAGDTYPPFMRVYLRTIE